MAYLPEAGRLILCLEQLQPCVIVAQLPFLNTVLVNGI